MAVTAKPKAYAWLIFFLSASFIFYKYILQISPAVITHQLMETYSLSGTALGFMIGFYFYTYMAMQIPSGILLDHFGPRKATSFAVLACAIGVFIFSQTHSFVFACIGRLLIGFGAAFTITSYMKLASMYFPARYFSLLSSLSGAAAMAGAAIAQAPLAWLIERAGLNWRNGLLIFSVLGVVLALAFWFIIKEHRQHEPRTIHRFNRRDFKNIFKNKRNWPIIFYNGFAFIPVAVFGGLWGVPYLMQAYAIPKTIAASTVSLSFIGFAVGAILVGIIGKHTKHYLRVMAAGTGLALVFISLVLYVPVPFVVLNSFVFLFGMCASSFLLCFTLVKAVNPPAVIATAVGVINMGDPLCGAFAEPLIGKILDLHWDGTTVDNIRVFSNHAYRCGLSVLPVYLILALICCCFMREKK